MQHELARVKFNIIALEPSCVQIKILSVGASFVQGAKLKFMLDQKREDSKSKFFLQNWKFSKNFREILIRNLAYPHRDLIGQVIKMSKEVGNMDDITIYVRKEARTIGVGHLRQKAGEVQTLLYYI